MAVEFWNKLIDILDNEGLMFKVSLLIIIPWALTTFFGIHLVPAIGIALFCLSAPWLFARWVRAKLRKRTDVTEEPNSHSWMK